MARGNLKLAFKVATDSNKRQKMWFGKNHHICEVQDILHYKHTRHPCRASKLLAEEFDIKKLRANCPSCPKLCCGHQVHNDPMQWCGGAQSRVSPETWSRLRVHKYFETVGLLA